MTALDTNVLVRLVTRDDPEMLHRAVARIESGPCHVPLTMTLEVEWVLWSAYRMPPAAVAMALRALTRLPALHFELDERIETALDRLAAGLDFAAALLHASSQAASLLPSVESV